MFDFPQFNRQVSAITKAGGIYSEGMMEGFMPVKYAGHDIELVLKGADLVFAVGPAYATEPFGKACAPYAEKGQIFVVCPSSCMGTMLQIVSSIMGRDYKAEKARTLETLGLAGYSMDELLKIL